MPIPSLQLQKKVSCLYREAEGLVAELCSPGLVEEYSDLRCFHVTAALLEIELSTTVGWKWGCQPPCLPMFAKCDLQGEKKRVVAAMLV